MDDLISRNAVLKIVKDEIKLKSSCAEHNAQIDILFKIKKMPSAYDVDKVLELLKENADEYDAAELGYVKAVLLEDAIEAVKSGFQ